jgi:glycosyltransferase involved in cell wall biosynthesis
MNQVDDSLVHKSGLTGDVVVINQCDHNSYCEYQTENGMARMVFTTQRGLTKSRNMAIEYSNADICLLCDDDEEFVSDYTQKIFKAYEMLPQADVIAFKMVNRSPSYPDRVMRLRFPNTGKVSSWQISFRRKRLLETGVRFDELLGAGTGNGAEEELKFLLDCERAGLKIYYVPFEIASVDHEASTWFDGFTETFFEDRGATTRYIMGAPLAMLYGVSYVARKHRKYRKNLTPVQALRATMRGILNNKIGKQAKLQK